MSNLECPACKQNIDGDSLYCDQCGGQIFICSVCGRAGKGKRCIFDGKEMVAPGGSSSSVTDHIAPTPVASTPAPAASVAAPTSAQAPVSTPTPTQTAAPPVPQAAPAPANKVRFTAQSLGIVIDANEGDVLGRTKGTFAAVLGRLAHISGSHCQIIKINGVWSIMDLGSTNGTFINGAKINPNTAMPLSNGAKVKLADIEFLVSMETADGGTQRI